MKANHLTLIALAMICVSIANAASAHDRSAEIGFDATLRDPPGQFEISAGREAAREGVIGAILVADSSTAAWEACAQEGGVCVLAGEQNIRYGSGSTFIERTMNGLVNCSNSIFGDPTPGVKKECQVQRKANAEPSGDSCSGTVPTTGCANDLLPNGALQSYSACAEDSVNQPTLLAPRGGEDTSIISLADGTLLMMRAAVAATSASQVASRIRMERSADNGDTWQMLDGAVQYKSGPVDGVSMLQLSTGRILATYHTWAPHPAIKESVHSLEAIFSDDNGISWTHLATVDSISVPEGGLGTGIWETFLIQPRLRPGVVQVYYARERDDAEVCTTHKPGLKKGQDIAMKESSDGGQTWGPLHISLRNGKSREGVPSVVETPDGAMFLAHEHLRFGGCDTRTPQVGFLPGIAMSIDGGLTWNELKPAYDPPNNFILAGWPQMVRLQDGRLAVRFAYGVLSSEYRYIKVILTKNRPSLNILPAWEQEPTLVLSTSQTFGALAQAQNGNIVVTGSNVLSPQHYCTVPLSALPELGR